MLGHPAQWNNKSRVSNYLLSQDEVSLPGAGILICPLHASLIILTCLTGSTKLNI